MKQSYAAMLSYDRRMSNFGSVQNAAAEDGFFGGIGVTPSSDVTPWVLNKFKGSCQEFSGMALWLGATQKFPVKVSRDF